jgi:hypothetical protein
VNIRPVSLMRLCFCRCCIKVLTSAPKCIKTLHEEDTEIDILFLLLHTWYTLSLVYVIWEVLCTC